MIKQVLLPILGVIIFIVAVGLFVQKSGNLSVNPTPKASSVKINNTEIQVTLAKTKEERVKGLSGTTSLAENSGMLFVFDGNTNPIFWMKDMIIPLDIIWIKNNKIIKIDKNVPEPKLGTPDTKLAKYSANQSIDYVLEVNAGFSEKNNIKVGDSVDVVQ